MKESVWAKFAYTAADGKEQLLIFCYYLCLLTTSHTHGKVSLLCKG